MRIEPRQIEQYLDQTLGAKVALLPWRDSARLAPFLQQLYGFWQTHILGTPCLLMVDTRNDEPAAAVVRKHVAQVRTKWLADVVYVRGQVTPYNRRRLIELKVPFVVPGNQMYLPMAGVDFRERLRRQIETPTQFSPATQVMVIDWLLKGSDERLTPRRTAQRLGYSEMTISRAFNELEATDLVEVVRHGKERQLRFAGAKMSVWEKAQPFLRSPVTKQVRVHQPAEKPPVQAGLTALAHYSAIAPPERPIVAVYGQDQKWLPLWHHVASIPAGDPDVLEIEVWRYRPDLFAQHGVADPLSVYLSLKDDEDERIQSALEEMIRSIGW
jgi:AraC-like DNA-binding protein